MITRVALERVRSTEQGVKLSSGSGTIAPGSDSGGTFELTVAVPAGASEHLVLTVSDTSELDGTSEYRTVVPIRWLG